MKYIVMECHPGYAVVLGENGKFLKVANMRYEVGQTVTNVTEVANFETAQPGGVRRRWIFSLAAMAACLLLLLIPSFVIPNIAVASVHMTINPEVCMNVNKKDMVIGLEGVNADGEKLIENYDYKRKELSLVLEELADLAIDMQFLQEGGKITLTLDSKDSEWSASHGAVLESRLKEYLSDKIAIHIEVADQSTTDYHAPMESQEREDAKEEREDESEDAKEEREDESEDVKEEREDESEDAKEEREDESEDIKEERGEISENEGDEDGFDSENEKAQERVNPDSLPEVSSTNEAPDSDTDSDMGTDMDTDSDTDDSLEDFYDDLED